MTAYAPCGATGSRPCLGDRKSPRKFTSTSRRTRVRTAIVLYFFDATEGEAVRDDLLSLARRWEELTALDARVLGVSRAKLPELKELQKELHLPFPLLLDDRGFAGAYGLAEATEDASPAPVLAVVDRRQVLVLLEAAAGAVDGTIPAVLESLAALPSPAASLPRKVVNWWVDRWVN